MSLCLQNSNFLGHLQEMYRFEQTETGYQKIQGTKPQTLAYALHDSPTGQEDQIMCGSTCLPVQGQPLTAAADCQPTTGTIMLVQLPALLTTCALLHLAKLSCVCATHALDKM